jgi:hypothetical protein
MVAGGKLNQRIKLVKETGPKGPFNRTGDKKVEDILNREVIIIAVLVYFDTRLKAGLALFCIESANNLWLKLKNLGLNVPPQKFYKCNIPYTK